MDGVIEQKEKLLAAWDDLMWGLMARGWDVQVYDYQAENEKEEESRKLHDHIMNLGEMFLQGMKDALDKNQEDEEEDED